MKLSSKHDLFPPTSYVFKNENLSKEIFFLAIPNSIIEKLSIQEEDSFEWIDFNQKTNIVRLKLTRR